MNNNFESYWKNEGQFLDYVNKNFDKEPELKEFARQICKNQENIIIDLENKISNLERPDCCNAKWDN